MMLQSHNVASVQPIADFVVVLGNDSRIVSHGSLQRAPKEDGELLEELKADEEHIENAEDAIDNSQVNDQAEQDGKLVVAEEIGEGHVGWNACKSSCARHQSSL